ncbi:MAG TPA: uroporphyrinogen-III C-methyltransferase [Gemmatimonadaceae bacterium]|nr:uroporphyrinogen-III C-methyltransferase [Gemmatimonadaceae bacterium]
MTTAGGHLPAMPNQREESTSQGADAAPARSAGVVYLVGAGPGDPGLLTVRARTLLDDCDAIVYDALANPALLPRPALDAVAPELHFVGKRGGDASGSARQDDINALLVRLAREGKRVVRLKGGDPFVFGRGSEEAQALAAAGLPFEVVPGVTAGIAAPAYAGIPVTHRGVATSVTFVTGHEDPTKEAQQTDWAALARAGGTIVLYMGVKRLPTIRDALRAGGMPGSTPAAAVQWGTYGRQRTVVATLDTLAERAAAEGITAPVITVVGPAVALREEIAWFDRPELRPLLGARVLVTRARAQASALADRLRALGADVVEAPAARVERIRGPAGGTPAGLRYAVTHLADYQWVTFTSQNAVAIFWDALREAGRDARALAGAKVCAVGPATADALLARGVAVDVLPRRFVAEGLLEALADRGDLQAARVLYATAAGARDALPEGLAAMGADVDVVPVYRTVADDEGAAELRAVVESGGVELVTFTSASTVRGFVDAVGAELARRVQAVSIGPITSEAARAAGIEVVAEAAESTIEGLVAAVVDRRAGRGSRVGAVARLRPSPGPDPRPAPLDPR